MAENETDIASAFDAEVTGKLPETVDEAAVKRMQTAAYVLDESIDVPGTDFSIGVDPLISAVPGAGDAVSAGLSLYVVVEAARLGVTYTTLLRMLANVAIDTGIGLVPWVGDAIDAAWKANVRNVELALADLADAAATGDGVEIKVE